MRFYAALIVVIMHATHMLHPGELVTRAFGMGAVGVSFFFILSGFVLTWSRKSSLPNRKFYQNRFARIFPLHFLTWIAAGALFPTCQGWVRPVPQSKSAV
ncbi:acyltransferase family protein [Cryobacterium roopkundense]|uniref:Peptidoglycan/LPS O-acetylase OafA/YrhL n=1 Tax=Cryobacterium roopkundense TaxID=1001240 RepID=A0A7W9E4M8_9MICO|nr:acyltransferase family protein [Cryobacterium roopkundense]MBB5642383.1 peptidoglycan/LPS O-acetylase OafA/YrhL [Cryobacterium roopkundense]